jgi:predicted metal-dependent phosphoesterase TrpH
MEKQDYQKETNSSLKSCDMHVHTSCSPDVLPLEHLTPTSLYEKGKQEGLDYIVFTDHDTMDAYDEVGDREDIVTGVEIKVKDMDRVGHTIHSNVYTLDKKQFEELEEIAQHHRDLEMFTKYCQDNGLPYTYNHPFWFEGGDIPNLKAIPEIMDLFPVVEYNMHRTKSKNELLLALAKEYGKGIVATTDTHSGHIGKARTLAEGDTFKDYFENVKQNNTILLAKDLTIDNLTEEINSWIENIFSDDSENHPRLGQTGMAPAKDIIYALRHGGFRKVPLLRDLTKNFFLALSNSRIPASLYTGTQYLDSKRINRELRLLN